MKKAAKKTARVVPSRVLVEAERIAKLLQTQNDLIAHLDLRLSRKPVRLERIALRVGDILVLAHELRVIPVSYGFDLVTTWQLDNGDTDVERITVYKPAFVVCVGCRPFLVPSSRAALWLRDWLVSE